MQDDFAPRPCRCVAAKSVAGVLLGGLLIAAVLALAICRQRDEALDALTTANQTIADQQATIDQQARIIQAWVDEHPPTDGELMGAGGRIIPQTKDAIARVQELLEKFDRLLEDVKAGRVGVEIDGSIMRGHAEAKLRRNP